MKDINTFVIIGRLTRDPEIKMTMNGMQVVSFTLAVAGGKRDQEEIRQGSGEAYREESPADGIP